MTVITPNAPAGEVTHARRQSVWQLLLKNPLTVGSLIVIAMFFAVALLQPWIQPYSSDFVDLTLANASPFTSEFTLGGDRSGRDILSRLIASTPGAVRVSLVLAVVAFVIGVAAGLIAGYAGKFVDTVSVWFFSTLMAVPGTVVLIALYTLLGASTSVAMAVFGVLISPSMFWMVRSLTRAIRGEAYVDAALVAGLSDTRIVGRHVLTAIRGPVILMTANLAGAGLAIQAGLEFLGLGDPSEPSWGAMLTDAFNNLYIAPVQILWPAVALGLVVGAFSLLSIGLRDVMEGTYVKPGRRTRRRQVQEIRRVVSEERASYGRRQGVAAAPKDDATADVPLLAVRDLVVAYPNHGGFSTVVKDVSLDVWDGEIVGIVGESGSGKTQTVLAALGLLPVEAIVAKGSIRFRGEQLIGLSEAELLPYRGQKIAYIPQEPSANLDPSFKIGSQLSYGIRAQTGLPVGAARKLARDMLDRVGIREPERVLGLYPHQISGGMAQRVLIAGAVARKPSLLIADEPTTALDVTIQAEVLDLIRELQADLALGVLIVTHNFGVVADLCDRVVVMQSGSVVEEGTVGDVFASAQHDYTKMLLASVLDDRELRAPLSERVV